MGKKSENAVRAKEFWDFLEKIAKETGHTKGEVHRSWKKGLEKFSEQQSLRKRKQFTPTQVSRMKALIETALGEAKPAPAPVKTTETVVYHTVEIVYEGNPGKFLSMLWALPNVKSVLLERD